MNRALCVGNYAQEALPAFLRTGGYDLGRLSLMPQFQLRRTELQ